MVNLHCIDEVSPTQQLSRWQQIMSEVYYRLEIKSDRREGLKGLIREYPVDRLSVTEFFSDRQRVLRTRHRITQDPDDSFVLVFPVRKDLYYEQAGRNGVVKPGGYVLVKTSEFYELTCPDGFRNITAKIPASAFVAIGCNPSDHIGCRYPNNPAVARMFRDFLFSIARMDEDWRDRLSVSVCDEAINLASMLLHSETGSIEAEGAASGRGLFQRILDYVNENLECEDLRPQSTAEAFSISRTYLDKLFARHGMTFCQTVLQKRLDRCYADLADPRNRQLSIAEIAYRRGFNSQSHFSRAFLAQFNRSPRQVRP